MIEINSDEGLTRLRLLYALRGVTGQQISNVASMAQPPQVGDLALARVVDVGRTTRVELDTGRMSTLSHISHMAEYPSE